MLDWLPIQVPIQEIYLENKSVRLFIKREDLIHPYVSGNKFWKLQLAVKNYWALDIPVTEKHIISFGGAFSNHITALSFAAKNSGMKSIGIIRGDELAKAKTLNPSLMFAKENDMELHFVSREAYRDKEKLMAFFKKSYPQALFLPEGGSNALAVEGIKGMLSQTKDFDYLCCAIGTGGTFAGIVKYAQNHQKCIGVKVVKDDRVKANIALWSEKKDYQILDYSHSRYGCLNPDEVRFMNAFFDEFGIVLDPIYTVKLLKMVWDLIQKNEFPEGSRILCFHTGGLQALQGMNDQLIKQNKEKIRF